MLTQEQFIRNFSVMTNGEVDFFLGAGASIASGIPTGGDLIWEFKRTLYCSENGISTENYKDLSLPSTKITFQNYFDQKAIILSINDRELFVNTYIANTKYDELSTCVNKEQIIAQCFILFPDIFSSSADKYKRMSVWLFAKGIVCRNTRDFISGSGKRVINNVGDKELPKIFYTLYQHKTQFKHQLEEIDSISLKYSWYDYQSQITIPGQYNDRIKMWLRLIYKEFGGASKKIDNTDYQFNTTIKMILDL